MSLGRKRKKKGQKKGNASMPHFLAWRDQFFVNKPSDELRLFTFTFAVFLNQYHMEEIDMCGIKAIPFLIGRTRREPWRHQTHIN